MANKKVELKYGNIFMPEDKLDPKVLDIRDQLIAGTPKTKVANEYKVSLEFVCRIYKRFSIGQIIEENKKKEQDKQIYENYQAAKAEKESSINKIVIPKDIVIDPEPEQPVTTVTEKKEEVKKEVVKKENIYKDAHGRLTEEGILYVVEQREAGVKVSDIAKAVGVSDSTVYNRCNEFGIGGKKEEEEDTAKKKKKNSRNMTPPVKTPKFVESIDRPTDEPPQLTETAKKVLEAKPYGMKAKGEPTKTIVTREVSLGRPQLRCGLIDGRHDGIPAILWVFEDNPGFSYFQYDKMEKIVNDFIDTHIPFKRDNKGNMLAKKDMVVYMTGLPCASATVIKVTNQRHVNLTLRHWMSKSNSYKDQVIWDQFGAEGLSEVFPTISKLYMTDCAEVDIVNGWKYYAIKHVDFHKDQQVCVEYIYPDLNQDIWSKFADLSSKIYAANTANRQSIYLYLQTIKNGRECNIKLIAKMSNHDFED